MGSDRARHELELLRRTRLLPLVKAVIRWRRADLVSRDASENAQYDLMIVVDELDPGLLELIEADSPGG